MDTQRHGECALTEDGPHEDIEKATLCKPRREASVEIKPADTLILGLPVSPELWENNRSFKPPSLRDFVMTALAN